VLDQARTPVRLGALIERVGDPRDPRAGTREVVLLMSIGALTWA